METNDKGKTQALISAICFFFYVGFAILIGNVHASDVRFATSTIVIFASIVGLAISIIIRRKLAVMVFSAITIIVTVIQELMTGGIGLDSIIGFLVYGLLLVNLILAINKSRIINGFFFLPSIVQLGYYLLYWFSGAINWIPSDLQIWVILRQVSMLIALLFAGLWLKKDVALSSSIGVNGQSSFNPQMNEQNAVTSTMIGGADRLKQYKELLDLGAITQEEFEDKKKQILGL